jgi:hypothetical protein
MRFIDRDHVGERLLLFARERLFLQVLILSGGPLGVFVYQVVIGFAQEARAADSPVIDPLAQLGLDRPDDRANERPRGVVLAAVAASVPHVLDLGFVQVRELVLLLLAAEAKLVDVVDDLAQVRAGLDLVFDLAEDLADLVLDREGPGGLFLELAEVGEQLVVDKFDQVFASNRLLVIRRAIRFLGGRPSLPAVRLVEQVRVFFAVKRRDVGAVLLQTIQVFEKEEPGSLLGVIELGGAACLFAKGIIDVAEGLFEHAGSMGVRYRKGPETASG